MTLHVKSVSNVGLEGDFSADVLIAGVTGEPRGWDVHERLSRSCVNRWFIVQSAPNAARESLIAQVQSRDPAGVVLDAGTIVDHLKAWLELIPLGPRSILVDVSCMSRPAMAQVFSALFGSKRRDGLAVTVSYSLAGFTPPPLKLPPNDDISPVNEAFAGWPSYPAAMTSLILGIGYEQDKAQGALEYFEPSDYWLFVPESPIVEYDTAVLENNENLVVAARAKHRLHSYSVVDPSHTFGLLASVVSGMIGRSNPIILPFGPKIFFALALIIASIYKEVGVWHVSGEQMAGIPDYTASVHSVAFKVEF